MPRRALGSARPAKHGAQLRPLDDLDHGPAGTGNRLKRRPSSRAALRPRYGSGEPAEHLDGAEQRDHGRARGDRRAPGYRRARPRQRAPGRPRYEQRAVMPAEQGDRHGRSDARALYALDPAEQRRAGCHLSPPCHLRRHGAHLHRGTALVMLSTAPGAHEQRRTRAQLRARRHRRAAPGAHVAVITAGRRAHGRSMPAEQRDHGRARCDRRAPGRALASVEHAMPSTEQRQGHTSR
jgi:hypothetical protein